MPFDPTLPAYQSPDSSAEMRGQLNALKDLIDTQAGEITDLNNACAQFVTAGDVNHAILSGSAGNCDPVASLNLAVSSPPTQTEVQAIANKVDELIRFLQRS